MANRTSSLTVELIDDVSKPARTVAEALKQAEAQVRGIDAAMGSAPEASGKLVSALAKLGASAEDIKTVAAAWKDYTRAAGLAADSDQWTKQQIADVKAWEAQTVGTIRTVMQERRNEAAAMRTLAAEQKAQLESDIAEQVAIVKKGNDDRLIAQQAAAKAQLDAEKAQADQMRRVLQAEQEDRIATTKAAAKKEADDQQKAQQAIIDTGKREEKERKERGKAIKDVTHGVTGGMLMFTVFNSVLEGVQKGVMAPGELESARQHLAQNTKDDASEMPFVEKLTSELALQNPALTQKELYDTYANLRENSIAEGSGGLVDKVRAEHNLRVAARAQVAALASGVELTPDDVKNLVKATDIAGKADDPTGLDKMFDSYLRYKQAGGELLTTEKILNAITNAKAANFSMDNHYLYETQFARATQMNPARLGSEEAMTLTSLAGGSVHKKTALWLADMGLIQGSIDTGGDTASYTGLVGKDLLETDQEAWATGPLLKALVDKGVLSDKNVNARMDLLRKSDPGADPAMLRENAEHGLISDAMLTSGLRNTVIDNLASLIANQRLIDRDIAGASHSKGLNAAETIGQNPIAALKELGGALLHFAEVAGGPLMKPAAEGLDKLAHAIEAITGFFSNTWKDPVTGQPYYLDGKGNDTPAPTNTPGASGIPEAYEVKRQPSGSLPPDLASKRDLNDKLNPSTPHVDTFEIEDAIHKAHMIQAVANSTSRPDVDTSGIDRAIDKAKQLQRILNSPMSFDQPGMTPSLDSTMRGNFSFGGPRGE